MSDFDSSSHESFVDYYAKESQSDQTLQRFSSMRACVLRVLQRERREYRTHTLEVVDIGCGAGTQSILWAELGCQVHALDVSERLLELARKRSEEAGYTIDFRLGSAVDLPWPDASMDVCLVPELLEHVADWKSCLKEFARVLRPKGVLFLTTSNKLCPFQHEFNLPFYSWYPSRIKRYYERLAITSRKDLCNYASYPAVNWFTFYGLRTVLGQYGLRCYDRFDVMDLSKKGKMARLLVSAINMSPLLRWLAHVATPSTTVIALNSVPSLNRTNSIG